MIDDADQMARDLPRMTLHGNIPTATTMALAARVVELLDRAFKSELDLTRAKLKIDSMAKVIGELRKELQDAQKEK